MNLLLHCCCGPCATVAIDHLRGLGDQITGWFFNPNISPPEEHARRRTAFEQMAEATGLSLLHDGPKMDFLAFLLTLASRGGRRCRACYELRLRTTAREAAARGFDGFSTTLLVSPHQDVSLIGKTGRAIARRLGLVFRFADLRERYRESHDRARELGLYRQNYCGCLFSALERAEQRASRIAGKSVVGGA